MRILLAEDDSGIAGHVASSLEREGYRVDVLSTGPEVWERGETGDYAAIVLDLGLPGLDGLSILKRWRSTGVETPVLVLTARGSWMERVDGFDAGADDYLPKPFRTEELSARLRALLRRSRKNKGGTKSANRFTLDEQARASDLAHGLKTPLTVLSLLVDGLTQDRRDTALKQIELVRQRADRQLQAARMGVEQMATTSVLGIAGKLVKVLSPMTDSKGIDWTIDIDAGMTLQADPADVAEAIGNILDNAVRFAHRRILLSASTDGQKVIVRIGDDGPGVDTDQHKNMLKRGETDAEFGHGLGLAISSDIAAAYGGELKFGQSPLGGLEARLSLPARSLETTG